MINKNFHSGFVTVIGRPNVGKSTLLNALIGEKISIISNKPQTTRNQIQIIYSDDRMQVVFLDTPGVQMPKNELGEQMLRMSGNALDGVDLCLFLMEPSDYIGKLDSKIIEKLKGMKTPIIQVINKMDSIDESEAEALKQNENIKLFDEIVFISAKEEDNLQELLDLIYKYLPEGPMYYPTDMITDRSERFVVSEIIREKCLNNMHDEIPHGIFVDIDKMHEREDRPIYDIIATIYVEKESHKGMVIGKGGSMLKKIGHDSRKEIEILLDSKVNLQLWVKVEKNWRRRKNKVKQFGYEA